MSRIQIYLEENVQQALEEQAEKKGTSVSTLAAEILEDYFFPNRNELPLSDLTQIVFKEVEDYIASGVSKEFDLRTASPTYDSISMTTFKRPSSIRAQIGKNFSRQFGKGVFANVRKATTSNGTNKLSVNKAQVYEIF